MTRPEPLLWLDDHRGVYIPRDFAQCWKDRKACVFGVKPDDWEILEAGPDHEYYWDTWNDVLDDARVTIANHWYRLYQDGALWLVPNDMEWNDYDEWFEWPKEEIEPDRDFNARYEP